jgi:tetratricopeptide (TPR) repeat protein
MEGEDGKLLTHENRPMNRPASCRRNAVAAALVFAFCGLLVNLAHADNSLNCTLQQEDGGPAAKLEVTLTNTGSNKQWKKKTSDKGAVEFKGLPDGTYRLEANMPAYLLTNADGIELSGNAAKTCSPVLVSITKLNQLLTDAMQAAKNGKADDAIEKAKAAVAMAPSVPEAQNMLALAYATKGMVDEAVASVTKAAQLDKKFEKNIAPIHMEALGTLASQAMAKQDFDTAIARYQEAQKVNPSEPTVYYNLALAYGHKNDYDNAIKNIDKAIELNPNDMEFEQTKVKLQDLYLKSTEKALTQ